MEVVSSYLYVWCRREEGSSSVFSSWSQCKPSGMAYAQTTPIITLKHKIVSNRYPTASCHHTQEKKICRRRITYWRQLQELLVKLCHTPLLCSTFVSNWKNRRKNIVRQLIVKILYPSRGYTCQLYSMHLIHLNMSLGYLMYDSDTIYNSNRFFFGIGRYTHHYTVLFNVLSIFPILSYQIT